MLASSMVRKSALALAVITAASARMAAADVGCVQRGTPHIISPGDPTWSSAGNLYNNGTLGITTTNPRNGTGSLELTTSGSLFDWAFFKRIAEGNGAWGLLSDINCVAFEWYREPYDLGQNPPWELTAETWQEQTPVLRLLLRDADAQVQLSQLVWEGWYNSRNAVVPTVNGQWNFEDMTGQQFWRHFEGGTGYDNGGCSNAAFISSSMLQTYTLGGWLQNCYSPSTEIYGVMVGLGSYWPGQYHGYVDNVQLAFNGQEGFAVEDNFDFAGPTTATPEPATMVLLGTGLLGLGGITAIRRRKAAASRS